MFRIPIGFIIEKPHPFEEYEIGALVKTDENCFAYRKNYNVLLYVSNYGKENVTFEERTAQLVAAEFGIKTQMRLTETDRDDFESKIDTYLQCRLGFGN